MFPTSWNELEENAKIINKIKIEKTVDLLLEKYGLPLNLKGNLYLNFGIKYPIKLKNSFKNYFSLYSASISYKIFSFGSIYKFFNDSKLPYSELFYIF